MNELLPARSDNFIHASGATLTVALYVYAKERAEFDVAFCHRRRSCWLLTLAINLAAKLVGKRPEESS